VHESTTSTTDMRKVKPSISEGFRKTFVTQQSRDPGKESLPFRIAAPLRLSRCLVAPDFGKYNNYAKFKKLTTKQQFRKFQICP
jgi:hypothetical protein